MGVHVFIFINSYKLKPLLVLITFKLWKLEVKTKNQSL